jgi:opacity protein-like surface antigen
MLRPCLPLAPAAVLAAALLAPPAAPAEDFVRDGWYAGARGVYALEDFDLRQGGLDADVDDDFGFNLFAGYRMLKGLASDFEFEYVDALPARAEPAGPSFDVRTFDLAWNFRVYPLAWVFEPDSVFQRVQPYLSAGPSIQWVQLERIPGNDRDEGNFAGRLGGGLDLYVTENIVITGDAIYTLGAGDVSDFPYWSIGWGVAYRFGGGEDGDGE